MKLSENHNEHRKKAYKVASVVTEKPFREYQSREETTVKKIFFSLLHSVLP